MHGKKKKEEVSFKNSLNGNRRKSTLLQGWWQTQLKEDIKLNKA